MEILAHERAHVSRWHSVDVLLGELTCAFCWFNPAGQENPGSIRPTHTITTLEELYSLVMEEDELQNVGSRNRRHQI